MKKFMFGIAFLLLLSVSVSCTKEGGKELMGGDYLFSNSFITWFYKMDSANLLLDTHDVDKSIYTFIWQGHFSDYFTKEKNPDEYKILCDKYGDSGLNAYLEIDNQASINNFSGISITSDHDFPDHPAGSDLSDIVYVRLSSAKPFIDSGYSKSYLNSDPVLINNFRLISATEGYTDVYKPAKDITKDDLMLIARNITIEFRDKPIEDKNDVFITVSLKQDGDIPIVSTYGVNFEKLAKK